MLAASAMTACMEVDNFDEPGAVINGRIIDSTTGEPFQTGQGECQIRIWEMSYSEANMDHQHSYDLQIKADGTYTHTKLFNGTYDMLARSGPWFPCDTVYDVKIGKKNNARQDFEITPYLKLIDFKVELIDAETLHMECRLMAPCPKGKEVKGRHMPMPNVKEVRPFLSLNQFCGAGSRLDYYYSNQYRKNINKSFAAIGDVDTGLGNEIYSFDVPVKPGYTYWVRMGANCTSTGSEVTNEEVFENFCYTEVVKVEIPAK